MFIDPVGDLKLGYLGFSNDVNAIFDMNKEVDSLNYLSPELLNFEAYNEKIDVW